MKISLGTSALHEKAAICGGKAQRDTAFGAL
jgi:hypothetical protein